MNRAIVDLFNDIFSNIYRLIECNADDCSSCVEKSRCIIVRVRYFYEGYLVTSEGKEFQKWKSNTKDFQDYSAEQFISEYKLWFSFYCFTQYEGTMNGQGIYDRRLLFFEPLFLTLPIIHYIKKELHLNYFYIYFINFNEPDVYSVFRIKELDDFKCYFPWYSGFRLESCEEKKYHDFLIESLTESNRHLERYIINIFEYKSQLRNNGKPFSKKTNDIIKFIYPAAINTLKEFNEVNLQNVEVLLKKIMSEIQSMEFLCGINNIKEKYFVQADTYHDERSLQEARLLLTNYCLQDILDSCLESFRELGLPKGERTINGDFFQRIICKNSYAWRERDFESWNHYLLSLRIDLFSIYILFKDYLHYYQSDLRIKELVDKLTADPLYREFINSLKGNVKMGDVFDFDEFLLQLKEGELNDAIIRKEIEQQFLNYKTVFAEVLKYECKLLQEFFSPYTFRNKVENEFDYGFVALHLSDLRYRLKSNLENIEFYDIYYEIHGILSYIPLPHSSASETKTKRLNKAKNFFLSFISSFVTKIVSKKMANIARAKRLEFENKKERTVAHLLKSLHASLLINMGSDEEKDKRIAVEISRYLSFYFSMRQMYSYNPIREEDSLYIDFIPFLEFLIIQDFFIFDTSFVKYERYTDILDRIVSYLKAFSKKGGGLKKENFELMRFEPGLKDHFFSKTNCLKLDYANEHELVVEINVSTTKRKYFPILATFTELVKNASDNRGDSEFLNFLVLQQNSSYYLIFSKKKLNVNVAYSYINQSQTWEEFFGVSDLNERGGFGLESIDFYLKQHNCRLGLLKLESEKDFLVIITVSPESNLFEFKKKGVVKK